MILSSVRVQRLAQKINRKFRADVKIHVAFHLPASFDLSTLVIHPVGIALGQEQLRSGVVTESLFHVNLLLFV
jgi:hypothetical protein